VDEGAELLRAANPRAYSAAKIVRLHFRTRSRPNQLFLYQAGGRASRSLGYVAHKMTESRPAAPENAHVDVNHETGKVSARLEA